MSAFSLDLPGWTCIVEGKVVVSLTVSEAKEERFECRACGVRIEKGRYAIRLAPFEHARLLAERSRCR